MLVFRLFRPSWHYALANSYPTQTATFPKVALMTILLVLVLAGFAIAVVVALVRGLTAFYKDAEALRKTGQQPDHVFGVKQNQMMAQRVLFQGVAILLIVLLGLLAS